MSLLNVELLGVESLDIKELASVEVEQGLSAPIVSSVVHGVGRCWLSSFGELKC